MATQIYPTFVDSAGESGAVREFWIKMEGLIGDDTGDTVVNTVENPMQEDLVILEALMDVKTAGGAVDGEFDIGLGDDVDGEDAAEICDAVTNTITNAVGVWELGVVHAIATPPVKVIWKAPNADGDATHSWLTTYQDGAQDLSSLVYNLLVKVIPYNDLV